jgi:hypothetical protein
MLTFPYTLIKDGGILILGYKNTFLSNLADKENEPGKGV